MKTLFMYDNSYSGIKFFELEGDYTKFNNVYINDADSSDELQQALSDLLFHPETGEFLQKEISEPSRDWTYFVRCGFLD